MPVIPGAAMLRSLQRYSTITNTAACWRCCLPDKVDPTDDLGMCDRCKDELRDPGFVKEVQGWEDQPERRDY